MTIKIDHNLGKQNALSCAKNILNELKEEHADKVSNLVQVWTEYSSNFSLRVKGITVKGEILVTDNTIEIIFKLPLAAVVFKGLIEDTINKHAKKIIEDCQKKNT